MNAFVCYKPLRNIKLNVRYVFVKVCGFIVSFITYNTYFYTFNELILSKNICFTILPMSKSLEMFSDF